MSGERTNSGGWRKSTRSGAQSNCVSARYDGSHVWVRNSNHPDDPPIKLPPGDWLAIVGRAKEGVLQLERLSTPLRLGRRLLITEDAGEVVLTYTHADGETRVRYTAAEWRAFLAGVVEDGEFTLAWLAAPSMA
ncbi:DUF397 domain-containing protein [Bailinhaonella thermotolerans]|uniref:DUF397 domain-containing protein n=1 Tax=Bailinhaonella thermotolerans TaxID=1070861 RepID=A0A3A4A8G0_9ACTN|nr:DUF397 domain-containing protein [Bailinhaonella thermotolerans]RJL21431.1 DUF397 domain-containing protein [Bailinhaonella thermotolerans]